MGVIILTIFDIPARCVVYTQILLPKWAGSGSAGLAAECVGNDAYHEDSIEQRVFGHLHGTRVGNGKMGKFKSRLSNPKSRFYFQEFVWWLGSDVVISVQIQPFVNRNLA